ncbi:MAG TPA: hypothetical protein VJ817_10535 [Gemmatimonadales bacterium]|nr:hypothetical protein [Gemmatimonadales bacterium]
MAIPPIIFIASGSQALPAIAALRHGRSLPVARRWIVAWGLAGLAFDAISLYFALRGQNNHWLSYISAPTMAVTALMALSWLQPELLGRRLLRLLALSFVAAVVILVAFVESVSTFSLLRGPIESLLIVAASLGTLLVLVRQEQGNLLQRDWFWVCIGLTLRYGGAVAIDPIARLLIGDPQPVVLSALTVKAVVDMAAYLLIARGVWCPVLPQPSSGPSSPVSLPSRLSSPPSAQPW